MNNWILLCILVLLPNHFIGMLCESFKLRGTASTVHSAVQTLGQKGDGFWTVKGANFYDKYNNKIYFSGVQMSGFETDGSAQGLWARNYKEILRQIKDTGFNVIRLSFAGETLKVSTKPNNINFWVNKELEGLNSLQVMDKIITASGDLGIKIILDYHRMRLTSQPEYGLWFDDQYPESTWISNWVMLAKKYAKNPTVVGFDLFNEVHNNSAFPDFPVWKKKTSNPQYNFRAACIRCINAIQKENKNAIIFIEGMWYKTWWGGNVHLLNKYPINSKLSNKIAYSVHEYGPNVWDKQPWFQSSNFPRNMPKLWKKNFGYIVQNNTKPVWVGEFGSLFNFIGNTDHEVERKWIYAFRDYINELQLSWTWFQWGPNSGDTGGILLDDWKTVNQNKVNFLKPVMHSDFGPSPGYKKKLSW